MGRRWMGRVFAPGSRKGRIGIVGAAALALIALSTQLAHAQTDVQPYGSYTSNELSAQWQVAHPDGSTQYITLTVRLWRGSEASASAGGTRVNENSVCPGTLSGQTYSDCQSADATLVDRHCPSQQPCLTIAWYGRIDPSSVTVNSDLSSASASFTFPPNPRASAYEPCSVSENWQATGSPTTGTSGDWYPDASLGFGSFDATTHQPSVASGSDCTGLSSSPSSQAQIYQYSRHTDVGTTLAG